MITTDLNLAIKSLKEDKLVAIPTETVYGLAGNAFKNSVIEKIFKLKKRPHYNPLIVHIGSPSALNQIVKEVPIKAQKLADAFWPGPLTLVLKKQDQIPDRVTAGKTTVAVRVPSHPLTLQVLNALSFPLAAPSANPFGSLSPTSALHVHEYFNCELELVLEGGNCNKGIESTIVGFQNDKPLLYRHGAIALEEIEKVAGPLKIKDPNDRNPDSPGMLSRHYAPKSDILITNDFSKTIKLYPNKKIGVLSFKKNESGHIKIHQEVLSARGDLKEAAKNFYAALHNLDQLNLDLIITSYLPNNGLGKTINDRLKRAAKK